MTFDNKKYQRNWQREWREKHPLEAKLKRRKSMKKWREENPDKHNQRNKIFRLKWAGIREEEIYKQIINEHPDWLSFNDIKPDFYDHKKGLFIEIKRASTISRSCWKNFSKYFPNLYFYRHRHTSSLDEQIEKYPKPLLVIIYDAFSGKELTRKTFKEN
jgi:hypothetical protein